MHGVQFTFLPMVSDDFIITVEKGYPDYTEIPLKNQYICTSLWVVSD